MKIPLILSIFLLSFQSYAQKTFWASRVIAFSSEYSDANTTKENRAIQALGKPNVLPQYGKSVCAWHPQTQDNPLEEFLIVGFDTLMSIRQVAIAENFGQGCIIKIARVGVALNGFGNIMQTAPNIQITDYSNWQNDKFNPS